MKFYDGVIQTVKGIHVKPFIKEVNVITAHKQPCYVPFDCFLNPPPTLSCLQIERWCWWRREASVL